MTDYNYDTAQPKKGRQAARQTARRDAVQRALTHHKQAGRIESWQHGSDGNFVISGWGAAPRVFTPREAELVCLGLASAAQQPDGQVHGQALAVRRLIDGLSTQTWCDLAPALSCSEAEAVHAFLTAWTDERTARVFMETHAMSDDPNEGDIHATQV